MNWIGDYSMQRINATKLERDWAALAGWPSWLEHGPEHQRAVASIPSQGTYLGCGFVPQSGCMWEAINERIFLTLIFFSLPVSLPLALKLINISLGED